MTLSTSSGDEAVDPNDKQIHQALLALDVDRDGLGWAILRSSHLTYIQASGDNNYGFDMEYQENDIDHHYRAEREKFSLKEVEQAFLEYRDRTIDWPKYGKWKRTTRG